MNPNTDIGRTLLARRAVFMGKLKAQGHDEKVLLMLSTVYMTGALDALSTCQAQFASSCAEVMDIGVKESAGHK